MGGPERVARPGRLVWVGNRAGGKGAAVGVTGNHRETAGESGDLWVVGVGEEEVVSVTWY